MGVRILIVEDEQIVAADLEIKLTTIGYEVVGIAASGEEATVLAEQVRPDIVLMDVQLQGPLTGMETARLIQRRLGVPIVFVTAYAGVFVRNPEQMPPPGICLSKPFSTQQLKAALSSVMRDPVQDVFN